MFQISTNEGRTFHTRRDVLDLCKCWAARAWKKQLTTITGVQHLDVFFIRFLSLTNLDSAVTRVKIANMNDIPLSWVAKVVFLQSSVNKKHHDVGHAVMCLRDVGRADTCTKIKGFRGPSGSDNPLVGSPTTKTFARARRVLTAEARPSTYLSRPISRILLQVRKSNNLFPRCLFRLSRIVLIAVICFVNDAAQASMQTSKWSCVKPSTDSVKKLSKCLGIWRQVKFKILFSKLVKPCLH